MSATADENTDRELLADFSTDADDTSAHVLWPADPQHEDPAGQLRIELDDGYTWSGTPVMVEARVSTPGRDEVQAVIRVQGLEPAWCPLPQVVTVSPAVTARLFVQLTPAAGTPPGRYLWSLTAEVRDRPMLATTAQLHVDRPMPEPLPPRPSRWRQKKTVLIAVATAVAVLVLLLVALTVLAPSWVFWRHETATLQPFPKAPAGPSRVIPTAPPSAAPGFTGKVLVQGTVLAEKGKTPAQIAVVRLNLEDLTGNRLAPGADPSAVPQATGVEKRIRGEHWSLLLPPGLYGLTFSKPGYVSESIVVATAVIGTIPRPHVRLDEINPGATASTKK